MSVDPVPFGFGSVAAVALGRFKFCLVRKIFHVCIAVAPDTVYLCVYRSVVLRFVEVQ